jgi:5,5'-dehydrodivanillate O-demethylase oxygenase subunit
VGAGEDDTMLSKKETALLTQVGPGMPCGELLRRYWQPACYAAELTDEQPILRVKIMHEDLVLYRDRRGNYGCLAEQCAHRGVSLAYGFVEECGLRCAYHGWQYDASGACIDQPFEPAGSTFRRRVRQPAYPVERLAGILFVYMGPPPAPLLPHWDVLMWTDGERKLQRQEVLNCNWLQVSENSADVTHTYFLHGHMLYLRGERGLHVDYYHRPIERYGFQPFEWGLLKSWRYASGGSPLGGERGGGNPLVFPNMLRVLEHPWHAMHWRVPLDNTHTRIFWAGFRRGAERQSPEELENPLLVDLPPQTRPDGGYTLTWFHSQDRMAWETQGAVFDRGREHLGASDRGIVLYRKMLKEQIDRVRRGEEPMALVRDAARNQIIDLPVWVAEPQERVQGTPDGERPDAEAWERVFDGEHEVFDVPIGTARPADTAGAGETAAV